MKAIPLILFALAFGAMACAAQEFEFYYPEEPLPGEEFPADEGVETQGILKRIVDFFRDLGSGSESDGEYQFVEDLPEQEPAPAVSTDPADPEKKPQGTILFGWRW